MSYSVSQEALMYAVYFAPRGKVRLMSLGADIAQRHLNPLDKLIGLVGDAGAGKSLLVRGMFPGLELSNDDEGVNVRPLPLLRVGERNFFGSHTYHVDVRFELAFTQIGALAEAVRTALAQDKRVVIEHFELIYPVLGMNAELLIGIGEEVIVTRPNVFGPLPRDLAGIVFQSIRYRKMTHTAEDLTCKILEEQYGMGHAQLHSDVRNGFVLEFAEKPAIDLDELAAKVQAYIDRAVDISYCDENHIGIGDETYHCTGPRIHVRNTGDIENFQLVREFRYNPHTRRHVLVGLVGMKQPADVDDLNSIRASGITI